MVFSFGKSCKLQEVSLGRADQWRMDVPLEHHQFEVIDPCFEVDASDAQLAI